MHDARLAESVKVPEAQLAHEVSDADALQSLILYLPAEHDVQLMHSVFFSLA